MPYFLAEVDRLGRRFHALVGGNASGGNQSSRSIGVSALCDSRSWVQSLDVVAGARSAADAHRQIAELRPDVAPIDINLGDESGSSSPANGPRSRGAAPLRTYS